MNQEQIQNNNQSFEENSSFWGKYKWWVIGGAGLLVVIGAGVILVNVFKGKDGQPSQIVPNQPVITKPVYTGKIYMATIGRNLARGQEAELDVLMDTNGTNIVAASFKLDYDPDKVEIVKIDKSRSVLSMDVIEKIENRQIELIRGKPGDGNPRDRDDGFTGQRGVLATIVVKPKVAGVFELKFVVEDTKMGVDDGKGTLAEIEVVDGEYIVE